MGDSGEENLSPDDETPGKLPIFVQIYTNARRRKLSIDSHSDASDAQSVTSQSTDNSDIAPQLDEGENWLRLLERKQTATKSILDETQEEGLSSQDQAAPIFMFLTAKSRFRADEKDQSIDEFTYVTIDVDHSHADDQNLSNVAIKDMRRPGDEEDAGTTPFELCLARRTSADKNDKPKDETSNIWDGYERLEGLPRRQLRLLKPGDRLCTRASSSSGDTSDDEDEFGGVGLILELQYQDAAIFKKCKTDKIMQGDDDQKMQAAEDDEPATAVLALNSESSDVEDDEPMTQAGSMLPLAQSTESESEDEETNNTKKQDDEPLATQPSVDPDEEPKLLSQDTEFKSGNKENANASANDADDDDDTVGPDDEKAPPAVALESQETTMEDSSKKLDQKDGDKSKESKKAPANAAEDDSDATVGAEDDDDDATVGANVEEKPKTDAGAVSDDDTTLGDDGVKDDERKEETAESKAADEKQPKGKSRAKADRSKSTANNKNGKTAKKKKSVADAPKGKGRKSITDSLTDDEECTQDTVVQQPQNDDKAASGQEEDEQPMGDQENDIIPSQDSGTRKYKTYSKRKSESDKYDLPKDDAVKKEAKDPEKTKVVSEATEEAANSSPPSRSKKSRQGTDEGGEEAEEAKGPSPAKEAAASKERGVVETDDGALMMEASQRTMGVAMLMVGPSNDAKSESEPKETQATKAPETKEETANAADDFPQDAGDDDASDNERDNGAKDTKTKATGKGRRQPKCKTPVQLSRFSPQRNGRISPPEPDSFDNYVPRRPTGASSPSPIKLSDPTAAGRRKRMRERRGTDNESDKESTSDVLDHVSEEHEEEVEMPPPEEPPKKKRRRGSKSEDMPPPKARPAKKNGDTNKEDADEHGDKDAASDDGNKGEEGKEQGEEAAGKASSGPALDGMVFCIAGKLSMKKADFTSLVGGNGGVVKGSVTKAVTHLISARDDTAKAQKAKESGVKILTEEAVMKLIARGGDDQNEGGSTEAVPSPEEAAKNEQEKQSDNSPSPKRAAASKDEIPKAKTPSPPKEAATKDDKPKAKTPSQPKEADGKDEEQEEKTQIEAAPKEEEQADKTQLPPKEAAAKEEQQKPKDKTPSPPKEAAFNDEKQEDKPKNEAAANEDKQADKTPSPPSKKTPATRRGRKKKDDSPLKSEEPPAEAAPAPQAEKTPSTKRGRRKKKEEAVPDPQQEEEAPSGPGGQEKADESTEPEAPQAPPPEKTSTKRGRQKQEAAPTVEKETPSAPPPKKTPSTKRGKKSQEVEEEVSDPPPEEAPSTKRGRKKKETAAPAIKEETTAKSSRKRKSTKSDAEQGDTKRARSRRIEATNDGHVGELLIVTTGVTLTNPQKNMLKKLGGKVCDDVLKTNCASHIIAGDKKKKISMRRTPKLMIGLSSTPNIVDVEWLTASAKANKVLPADNFLLTNDETYESTYEVSMQQSLERAAEMREKGEGVLSDWFVHVCKGVAGNKAPPEKELKAIVQAGGGTWTPSLTPKALKEIDISRLLIITSDPETKAQVKAVARALDDGARKMPTSRLFQCMMKQEVSFEE